MIFKLDENVPAELVRDLASCGHDAHTVADQGMTGADDSILMSRIRQEKRILITMDKGIADVRAYPPTDYAGIVLLRPRQTGRGAVLRFARLRVAAILEHQLDGRLLIVNERGIRIR